LFRSVSLRDFAGPIEEQSPIEPVELRVVEVALLDVAGNNGFAVTVCRWCPELAGTTPTAVAVRELHTTKHPTICHRTLPEVVCGCQSMMSELVRPCLHNRLRFSPWPDTWIYV